MRPQVYSQSLYGDLPPGDVPAAQSLKLNFQPLLGGGQKNLVILPRGMMILALPQSGQEQVVDQVIYTGKLAHGVSLRDQWKNVQTAANTWNFSYFDSEIARATQYGKSVMLRVNMTDGACPGWVKSQVAQIVDTNTGTTIQVYWDPTYVALQQAFWQALGARYANTPCVKYIAMNPPGNGGGDWAIPYQNAGNWRTVTAWNVPAVNGTVTLTPDNTKNNPPIYAGVYVLVQGTGPGYVGWFLVTTVNGTNAAPTSIVIQNIGAAGNAAPGTSVPTTVGLSQNMINNWTSPMIGYTTQNVVNGITAVTDAQFKAFPRQLFSMSMGTNGGLDTAVNPTYTNQTCAQMTANYCYTKYGSRFSIAKNGFRACTPPPNNNAGSGWEIFNLLPYISREGQFFWWTVDTGWTPTNNVGESTYSNNCGVPADPILVLQQAAQIAAAYGVARLEYYMQDVEALQQLNVVYRQMPLVGQSVTAYSPKTPGYTGPNKITA